MKTLRVAIIGSGASGMLACRHLLDQARSPALEIQWIGSCADVSDFGLGIPYGTNDPQHLLNVRVAGMSALIEEPLHFSNWLKEQNLQYQNDSFVPRGVYGQYLKSLVSLDDANVRRHASRARGLRKTPRGYEIDLQNGHMLTVDQVILALGVVTRTPSLGMENPWPTPILKENQKRVLIIGTGLTMVDLVMTYEREPVLRKICAVSRGGLLPRVHADYAPHKPSEPFQNWLTSTNKTLRSSVAIFRDECQRAIDCGSDWRAIFDLIRPVTAKIWKSFSSIERRKFLRHVARYWDVHRHRVAPEIYERLQKLQKEGALEILKGDLREVRRNGEGWEMSSCIESAKQGLEFDALISSRGLSRNVSESSSELIQQLLRDRILVLDDPPLGAQVSPQCLGLYLIGPLRRGSEWESVAIPELRLQASEIARSILVTRF